MSGPRRKLRMIHSARDKLNFNPPVTPPPPHDTGIPGPSGVGLIAAPLPARTRAAPNPTMVLPAPGPGARAARAQGPSAWSRARTHALGGVAKGWAHKRMVGAILLGAGITAGT